MEFAGSCPGLGEHAENIRAELEDDLQERQEELFDCS